MTKDVDIKIDYIKQQTIRKIEEVEHKIEYKIENHIKHVRDNLENRFIQL